MNKKKNRVKIFSDQIILPDIEINFLKFLLKLVLKKNILIYLDFWTEERRSALYEAVRFCSHLGCN